MTVKRFLPPERSGLRARASTRSDSSTWHRARSRSSNWTRRLPISALAEYVQPTILAAHGEHKSVETTNAYYVTQSVDQRAGHTGLISRNFVHG